jgi:BASS family bile acid:Na+ symporter
MAAAVEISFLSMVRTLCMVIFVPMLLVEVLKRVKPDLLERMTKTQFPASLLAIAFINLGVFSRYTDFFYQKPSTILVAILVAIALCGIYLVVALVFQWREPLEDQLASAVSLGNVNNILVIVFSAQFFGPLEPMVAAMYQIPFFGLILPLRFYQRWRSGEFR